MYDVLALGELLIDFTPHGVSESGANLFEQNPGGAPANAGASACDQGRLFVGSLHGILLLFSTFFQV